MISSNDFPLVSGMKKYPKMAFSKQMIPNVIIHLNSPKCSRKIGNFNPSKNKTIHIQEITHAKHI